MDLTEGTAGREVLDHLEASGAEVIYEPQWRIPSAEASVPEAVPEYETLTLAVTYSASQPLQMSTIIGNDRAIRVTDPDGSEAFASYVDIDDPAAGTMRTAMYELAPPDGGWDTEKEYAVHLQPQQVADANAVYAEGDELATFSIDPAVDHAVVAAADGTVIDENLDGTFDAVITDSDVRVGWSEAGQERGVFQFDLGSYGGTCWGRNWCSTCCRSQARRRIARRSSWLLSRATRR